MTDPKPLPCVNPDCLYDDPDVMEEVDPYSKCDIWFVQCSECGWRGSTELSDERAIFAWNRAPRLPEKPDGWGIFFRDGGDPLGLTFEDQEDAEVYLSGMLDPKDWRVVPVAIVQLENLSTHKEGK